MHKTLFRMKILHFWAFASKQKKTVLAFSGMMDVGAKVVTQFVVEASFRQLKLSKTRSGSFQVEVKTTFQKAQTIVFINPTEVICSQKKAIAKLE